MPSEKVFINCPFDDEYYPIFRALVFTCLYLGYEPVVSNADSGSQRIISIIEQMKVAKLSIHDLSRTNINKANKLPRFNMPFELGIDYGLRNSGLTEFENKRFLIFEQSQHQSKVLISDLAGCDLRYHSNSQDKAIEEVRNWLYSQTRTKLPFAASIVALFVDFEAFFIQTMVASKRDIRKFYSIPFEELKIEIVTFLNA